MGAKGGARRGWARFRFVAGAVAAALVMLLLAEVCLRLWPPSDLRPFLGEASGLSGPYVADAWFGYTYREYEAFAEQYRQRLDELGGLDGGLDGGEDRRPTWAFFGNSFVQAPGMLADTMQAMRPDVRVFHLRRNEPLELRLAQAAMLLDHGLRPRRLFVTLLPIDALGLGPQPLSTVRVTTRGAVTYQVRRTGTPADALIGQSRLALTAWVRSGWHVGNPWFDRRSMGNAPPPPRLLADLRHLFAGLAAAAKRHDVPVTVILIPSHQQVMGRWDDTFQRAVTPMLVELDLDVLDTLPLFIAADDKPGLFIPDKHFSHRGNRMLAQAVLEHVGDAARPEAGTSEGVDR